MRERHVELRKTGKPYVDWEPFDDVLSCCMFASILANNWSMRPSIPSSFASRAEAVLSPLQGLVLARGLYNGERRVLHTSRALEMPFDSDCS